MKLSLRRRHALMVEDGAFSHKIDNVAIVGDFKSRRASKLHYWFKSYGKWVDLAYWWSFIGGGSAINGATPSSLFISIRSNGQSLSYITAHQAS